MDKDTNDTLALPYNVIDITGKRDEQFILTLKRFREGQDERSIQNNSIEGEFEVTYRSRGIQSTLECDITIGNLYYFDYDLDTAYDINFGRNATAVLESYTPGRTKLVFRFDENARCFVSGSFKNKGDGYKSGISFEDLEIDAVYVSSTLGSLMDFFPKIKKLQGHSNFF